MIPIISFNIETLTHKNKITKIIIITTSIYDQQKQSFLNRSFVLSNKSFQDKCDPDITIFDNEWDLITGWLNFILDNPGCILIGWNICYFDIPVIQDCCKNLGLEDKFYKVFGRQSMVYKVHKIPYEYYTENKIVFDLYLALDKRHYCYKLHEAMQKLIGETISTDINVIVDILNLNSVKKCNKISRYGVEECMGIIKLFNHFRFIKEMRTNSLRPVEINNKSDQKSQPNYLNIDI